MTYRGRQEYPSGSAYLIKADWKTDSTYLWANQHRSCSTSACQPHPLANKLIDTSPSSSLMPISAKAVVQLKAKLTQGLLWSFFRSRLFIFSCLSFKKSPILNSSQCRRCKNSTSFSCSQVKIALFKEQHWVLRSRRSLQKSHHELIALVAH